MIGARAASVVSDGLVLVLTVLRTFRRIEASAAAIGAVTVLRQILLRDSEYALLMTLEIVHLPNVAVAVVCFG